jgi:hypothetical protein
MLGKLIKNEFKSTYRLVGTLLLCMLAVGVLIFINGKIGENSSTFETTQAILETGQIWVLVAAPFVILGFLVYRFYRSMLGDEGYLSFTLPVTTGELILSKWLVAFIWMIVTVGVMIGSLVMSNGSIVSFFQDVLKELNADGGISGTMLLTCVSVLASFAYMLMLLYTSMAIGQLFFSHKIIGSVLGYFILNTLENLLSTFSLIYTDELNVAIENSDVSLKQLGETIKLFNVVLVTDTVEKIICAAIGFFLCRYLLKNHLNLE